MNIENSQKFSTDRAIESAYVITVRGNEISEDMARRCIQSCRDKNVPVKVWEAFDGQSRVDVKTPNFLKDKE
jgi:hypothetical protein